MADEIETPDAAAEEAVTTDPLEALTSKFDEEIKSVHLDDDPADNYGIEADEPRNPIAEASPDNDSGDEVVSWKRRALEAERRAESVETRGKVREVMDRVNQAYPNAYRPTVDRAIRQGASPEAIEARAKASHSDFNRGYAAAMGKAKAEIATYRESATQEAEAEVRGAWGNPPSVHTGVQGGQMLTPDEYMAAIKKPGITDAEVDRLFNQTKWGASGPPR